jgi:FMN phosphatase YigB (HAD superfamily)
VILTLLLDIDDTLIVNKMETFIPAYLNLIGNQLTPSNPRRVGQILMEATEKMIHNDRPDRTLKKTFDPHFYPPLGLSEQDVRADLDFFYDEIFPTLRSVTKTRPEAQKLIQEITHRGWHIAIATNPVFPIKAILHRLCWAGIPIDKYSYSIVPSFETFHFGKPNPAFFAELLGRIGWPRGPILMVGNDPENDIDAAQRMGIPTFWISNGLTFPEEYSPPNASGELEDILPWIDSISMDTLNPDYSATSAIVGTMRGIPAALLTLVAGIPDESWKNRPGPDEWSLTEIACHLRDVEKDINLPRLRRITQEENSFIPGVDSDVWAITRDYQSQDGSKALHEFVSTRMETLELLSGLSVDEWQRSVQHAIFGPTSLAEIAGFMAGHDRLHIRQTYAITGSFMGESDKE